MVLRCRARQSPARLGLPWPAQVGHGRASRGMSRRGHQRCGLIISTQENSGARFVQGWLRQGSARYSMARSGRVRAWCGMARCGAVWRGPAWEPTAQKSSFCQPGLVGPGKPRRGPAIWGLDRRGWASPGAPWQGFVGRGWARQGLGAKGSQSFFIRVLAGLGTACQGTVGCGQARWAQVGLGRAGQGVAWEPKAQQLILSEACASRRGSAGLGRA